MASRYHSSGSWGEWVGLRWSAPVSPGRGGPEVVGADVAGSGSPLRSTPPVMASESAPSWWMPGQVGQALGVSALGVSALGVSALGVSALGVSALGVSALGVSALGVSALGVSALGVSALGVSALGVSALGVSALGVSALGVSALGADGVVSCVQVIGVAVGVGVAVGAGLGGALQGGVVADLGDGRGPAFDQALTLEGG